MRPCDVNRNEVNREVKDDFVEDPVAMIVLNDVPFAAIQSRFREVVRG
jgi:hypothetical protein